jgi:hypothetical protein
MLFRSMAFIVLHVVVIGGALTVAAFNSEPEHLLAIVSGLSGLPNP